MTYAPAGAGAETFRAWNARRGDSRRVGGCLQRVPEEDSPIGRAPADERTPPASHRAARCMPEAPAPIPGAAMRGPLELAHRAFLPPLKAGRRNATMGASFLGRGIMDGGNTYTKGLYTAKAHTRKTDNGRFQGYVILSRDEGGAPENTLYEVEATSANEAEAFDEAKALAHRILGDLEL
ncbi:hypothetical protein D0U02_01855 [Burkholderia pseudomallei]|uniref:Uncharacterized protein n=1 Tax=Burkholderia pseudomallei (strain K96243) TaxID=272560 RepID=Q63Y69_BURPS|nr:hypothetical protein D0U05_00845 [Burkholderia pseudomallei]CAH34308.1 hypothetical protein BPSL0319 [Burkholderia pseudomallei K96243]RFS67672.1 hypothetical protein D0U02_01855 [Burkholderia pseudomallei]RFS70448.1 hypothetical protein D0U01_05275 [Burkholderia pseudomallei]RFS76273.1 hypothetical protein D0T98_01860 [Burkholderia pseudomallei]